MPDTMLMAAATKHLFPGEDAHNKNLWYAIWAVKKNRDILAQMEQLVSSEEYGHKYCFSEEALLCAFEELKSELVLPFSG